MSRDLPANEKPGKHPFFIKNIPYKYSLCEMKNMSKGITSFKINKGPQAYKLKKRKKKIKMPVIPFLSLSSGGRSRRQKRERSA